MMALLQGDLRVLLLAQVVLIGFPFLLYLCSGNSTGTEERVLLDHDGGTDDFIALMVLMNYHVLGLISLEGIAVTPADCYILPALGATQKVLRLYGQSQIEVSRGVLHGQNSFPDEWRARAFPVDALPLLNMDEAPLPPLTPEPGHEFLRRKLQEAEEPLTVVVTGPLTNLGEVLTTNPELSAQIRRVVWMGGAFEVRGNVKDFQHDGSAEWNAYWDPRGARRVFAATGVPLVAFPCDVTDNVPVTRALLQQLSAPARVACPLAHLVGQMYALTTQSFPSYADQPVYYMWDTLTALSLGLGDRVAYATKRAEVLLGEPSAGRTRVVPEGEPGGREVTVAVGVEPEEAYAALLRLFDE
ncbi:unnamed protein product, partial [Heterosigma akashiwo]